MVPKRSNSIPENHHIFYTTLSVRRNYLFILLLYISIVNNDVPGRSRSDHTILHAGRHRTHRVRNGAILNFRPHQQSIRTQKVLRERTVDILSIPIALILQVKGSLS
jgi:hypothetical protein